MSPLATVKDLVRADLGAVDAVIRASMKSTVGLVDQVAEHIISGGGKRLRPLIVLLSSRACGYRGSSHIDAAAFIDPFYSPGMDWIAYTTSAAAALTTFPLSCGQDITPTERKLPLLHNGEFLCHGFFVGGPPTYATATHHQRYRPHQP